MTQLRLGVVGCGVIGRQHQRWAGELPQIDLAAVADLREDSARSAAKEFGASRHYTDGNALIDDADIDAVVLALPTAGRSELALRAFGKGKHVLIEKPSAMNVAEAERLRKAQGDLVAASCSSRFQYFDSTKAATEFVATGALGNIRLVHCRGLIAARPKPESPPPPWRLSRSANGGGILVNWGCYDLDYLLSILGWTLVPKVVLANTWQVPPPIAHHVPEGSDAETYVAAHILCEGGTALRLERGEYMPCSAENAWQIVGDEGSLRLQMIPGEGKQVVFETADDSGLKSEIVWQGDESSWEVPHRGVLENFADSVLNGTRPGTDLDRWMTIQKIFDAIYASADNGEAVTI